MSCALTGRRSVRCRSCRASRRWVTGRYASSWRVTISHSLSTSHTKRLRRRVGKNSHSTWSGFPAATTPPASCRGKRSTPGRSQRSSGSSLATKRHKKHKRFKSKAPYFFCAFCAFLWLDRFCAFCGLLRQGEDRLDIDRHILQLFERLLHRWPDHRELIQYHFRLVIRPLGFECEQVARELCHT